MSTLLSSIKIAGLEPVISSLNLSGSLFDYMSPENNSAEVEYYMDYTEHINYWTEEFFERRFGAFFSDYVYFL